MSHKTLRYGFRKHTRRPRAVSLTSTTHLWRKAVSHAASVARATRRAERRTV